MLPANTEASIQLLERAFHERATRLPGRASAPVNDMRASAVAGAVDGAAGTVAMSVLMLGARQVGLVERLPPERITAATLDALGLPHSRGTRNALAPLLHLGFGVVAGVLFGLLRRVLRLPLSSVLQGTAYGCLVWLVSYMGWVPMLGLMPPASRDQPRRTIVMVGAHLLYGAVLGAFAGRRT